MHLKLPPASLREHDWDLIESVFCDHSMFLAIIRMLRKSGNTPQRACDLFNEAFVNQGNENLNVRLITRQLPYRLTRIGSWANENRRNRLLAIVVLPQAHMDKLTKRNIRPRVCFTEIVGG